jgi:hypothetical protein
MDMNPNVHLLRTAKMLHRVPTIQATLLLALIPRLEFLMALVEL